MRSIFLDRDGVLNKDTGYVSHWEEFHFLDGVIESLKSLMELKFQIFIVTNQSGIARGYYSENEYLRLEKQILEFLKGHGILITDIYYCPHHEDGTIPEYAIKCGCRKPMPGMFLRAADEYLVDFSTAIAVGDKESDMKAAAAVGIKNRYLISQEMKCTTKEQTFSTHSFSSLLNVALYLTDSTQVT